MEAVHHPLLVHVDDHLLPQAVEQHIPASFSAESSCAEKQLQLAATLEDTHKLPIQVYIANFAQR